MSKVMRSWGLGLSQKLLAALLRLYPHRFHRTFASEMQRSFRLRYRRALLRRGALGIAALWTRTVFDILKTAWAERRESCFDESPGRSGPPPPRRPRSRGDHLMTSLLADLRIALRSFSKRPGYALAAILTLALGIGANSAIFSLVHSILLQPLPYPDSHRLVMIHQSTERGHDETFSFFDLQDFSRESRALGDIAAFHESDGTLLMAGGEPQYVRGQAVSASLIPLLGVEPLLGRSFRPEEDREGGPRAIILSYGLWQGQFGGDPQVLGRVVEYQELSHTIVGVMPKGFYFPDPDARFWTALQGNDLLTRAGIQNPGRRLTFLLLIARLNPQAKLAAAQGELNSISRQVEQQQAIPARELVLVPRLEAVSGSMGPLLWTLLASVGLVLLIACANVANLSLSRAAARRREMALRNALGASRPRLIRQVLTESVLLAGLGASVGVLLAVVFLAWLAAAGGGLLPRSQEIALDWRVLLFTALIALLSSLLFGLLPALKISRLEPQSALRAGGRGSAADSPRLQKGLVVCQIALALVLLSGAGLLLNSFIRLTSVSVGFRPDRLLTVWLSLSEERYPEPEAVVGFYEDLVDRLQALPGVESVSYSYSLPFTGNTFRQTIVVEGQEPQPGEREWAGTVIVGPRHFETLGIPLLKGRDFSREDRLASAPVAIVNQAMARRYWPQESALGKRFRRDGGVDGTLDTTRYFRGRSWITVVGVTADVVRLGYEDQPAPEFYVPHAQMPWASTSLVLRTRADPLGLVEPLRRVIAEKDPGIALFGIDSMQQRMDRSVLPQRLRTQLWMLFAVLASSLAVIGVYGVMAFGVSRRTQEIGIRMALGADRLGVLRMILAQGLSLAGLGALIGLVVSLAANRALAGLLYQVTPFDPLTYSLVALLLLAVAALACYLPARRASHVDPLAALRCE
ncbi:MAG TPA: ABC transporter permease [Acidobacteriota bacterium]|nr:ABC transporter permease [Acidobacteriota bacterium]